MKKVPILLTVAAILLIGGCVLLLSSRPVTAPSPSVGGPLQIIRVANIGQYSLLNLVAMDRGYFTANGLEAHIEEYDSGATSIAALLDGRADVAIAGDFVGVAHMFMHKDLRMIAKVGEQDVFRLMIRRDRDIQDPSHLKGKRVGVTQKTAGELYLSRLLAANGLTESDVTVVNLPPMAMIEQLKAGELDAILIFDPHAHDLQKTASDMLDVWPAQGGQKAEAMAYAMASFTALHGDIVEKYLAALVQAERYVAEYPAETRRFVAAALKYDDDSVENMWRNSEFALSLSQDMLLNIEGQARWVIDAGLTDQQSVPNYLDFIFFPGLEKAKPGSVTIVH